MVTISCKIGYTLQETKNLVLIGIKANKFRGTIFKGKYPFEYLFVSDIDSNQRFTPIKEEIASAEGLLKEQIKCLNQRLINQIGNCPVIHRNLNNYFRQYVGFYNSEGNKLIHINFYWDNYIEV